MLSEDKYFRDLTVAKLWQRYCGFLDLSIGEFIDIQEELLMDQIERVADSLLGKKIMGNQKPESVEEFRRIVPLTTYDDYEPYLSEQREDALAVKPRLWCHSSGRGGYFKWIPYGSEFLEKVTRTCIAALVLATAGQKGRVNVSPGVRILVILPPAPYTSGSMFQAVAQHLSFQAIPDPEKTQSLDFQERIREGFHMALRDGVDIIGAIASVLVRIGEEFSEATQSIRFSWALLHPRIIYRLSQAWLRSKREKRPMLPKDLWPAKAILTGGVDTAIYTEDVAKYWGHSPHEFYAATESFFLAVQGWNRKCLTFVPDLVFFEFIPYEEQREYKDDNDYQPATVLLDEVEEEKLYEVVITQFYGMPLLRYRMGDIIKVTAMEDKEAGVKLPQIVFQRRVGENINLGGLAELDEKIIWQAIANTGIRFADWSACKEYKGNQTFIRLYIELKEQRETEEIETMIDEQLKIVDTDYKDIESYLDLKPVRVTLLQPGTFQRYMEEKRKEGADLAHLKPAHVNPTERDIQRLLELSRMVTEK